MGESTYFLIPKLAELNSQEDFVKLISWLIGQELIVTQESENNYKIAYKDRPHKARIEIDVSGKIKLSVTHGDGYSVRNIKEFARTAGYKIYCLELNSFIPDNTYIRDLTTLPLSPEILRVFTNYGFEPLFVHELPNEENLFYARKKSEAAIYATNPYLLDYYLNWGGVTAKSDEFSYEVAPNIERFTQYANRSLIPSYFYEKYDKDLKILNYSGIDIEHPKRKIFVKPIVMQIDNESFQFYTQQGERGSMILMDKILENEDLDQTLNRILKQWGLSDGYLRALVSKHIEFDKDKAGLLIPRILVYVYVEKLLKSPEGAQRNWDPIKDTQ